MDKIFRQWTDEYQDPVWSLALYLLRDRAEAEDVVQEAFIRLWQHRESVSGGRVRPWLLRVTRNLCLDRLRKRRPEVEIEDQHALSEGPAEGLQNSQLGLRLKSALARLAEPYRSLVILRDVQQGSYEDVARATGLSMPQVKTYLHRARKQLREHLLELRP